MKKRIAVYVEGQTEWYTIHQMRKRRILANAEMIGCEDRGNINRWLIGRDEVKSIIAGRKKIPQHGAILFVFDQETNRSPLDVAREMEEGSFHWSQINGFNNIFSGQLSNGMQAILHISTASSPDGNRDFDGYILKILDQWRENAVNTWFEEVAHDYIKRHSLNNGIDLTQIHDLGREKIPELMNKNKWNILRSKTMLYAYITALQADKSHVWFSEKIIKFAPDDVLREVFANLIAAWDLLAGGLNEI